MRKIIRKRFLEFSVAFCLLFIIYSCFAQEQISITTYYPAPIGIYGELRAARMAIGDGYIDPTQLCWPGSMSCSNAVASDADLIVQGFVGIGTPTPTEPLVVAGNATVAGNLSVGGNALVGSNVSVGDTLSVRYNATIGRNVVVGANLTVSGNSTMAQNLAVLGNTSLSSGSFNFIGPLMTMNAVAVRTYDPMQFRTPYYPTGRVFEKNDEGCDPNNIDSCGQFVASEITYTGI